jgi:hypothetical protein
VGCIIKGFSGDIKRREITIDVGKKVYVLTGPNIVQREGWVRVETTAFPVISGYVPQDCVEIGNGALSPKSKVWSPRLSPKRNPPLSPHPVEPESETGEEDSPEKKQVDISESGEVDSPSPAPVVLTMEQAKSVLQKNEEVEISRSEEEEVEEESNRFDGIMEAYTPPKGTHSAFFAPSPVSATVHASPQKKMSLPGSPALGRRFGRGKSADKVEEEGGGSGGGSGESSPPVMALSFAQQKSSSGPSSLASSPMKSRRKSMLHRRASGLLRGSSGTNLAGDIADGSVAAEAKALLAEEQSRLEDSWNSVAYKFLSWDDCNSNSDRDPPLVLKAKGFPLECGNKGVSIPELGSLSFVDSQGRKPHYQDRMRLIPHFHWLFSGSMMGDGKDPVVVSCEARSDKGKNERCFLVVLRSDVGDKRFVLTGSDPKRALKEFVKNSYPKVNFKKDVVEINDSHESFTKLGNDLAAFENSGIVKTYKIGVLYWKENQDENEAFSNQHSEEFDDFLKILGDKIQLKGWDKFRGGLNVTDDVTGSESVFVEHEGFEVMYHVSTLLPLHESDVQKLERKRHLGNDIVIVIFKEGDTPLDPTALRTQFNHVFIIVEKISGSNPVQYRVEVTTKPDVPRFEPQLPDPPIFNADDPRFREFMLYKIINGERASMIKAKDFRVKMKGTRKVYLKKMVDEYK